MFQWTGKHSGDQFERVLLLAGILLFISKTQFFHPHFVSRVAQLENQVRRSSVNTKAFFINFSLTKSFYFFYADYNLSTPSCC